LVREAFSYVQRSDHTLDGQQVTPSSHLYLVTDIKVCQDAEFTTNDSSEASIEGDLTIPMNQIVEGTAGVGIAILNVNPSAGVKHKYASKNKGSSVAQGSRIFAIRYRVVTRSF